MTLDNPALLQQANFINGKWLSADSAPAKFAVTNPATDEIIGYVPSFGKATVDEVVTHADTAWQAFRRLTAKERADLLFRFRKQIMDNQHDLAKIITLEQGKPLTESLAEIQSSANTIEWFAEEVKRIYGETIPPHSHSKRLMTIKQPIGVTAAITPWNFPSSIVTRKCAPALAAGCAIVIKPAPETPFSAIALAYLSEQAGFPSGIFNVITGDEVELGKALCENKTVRMISFTGSTAVGRILLKQSADTIKKVTLELGGNAPFIVFDDADIDKAVSGTIACKFRNSGQTCISANRIIVDKSIYPEYLDKLSKAVATLKVGDGLSPDVQIGPLITHQSALRLQSLVEQAVDQGANLVTGGNILSGNFFAPTILTDTPPDIALTCDEIFGPVAPIMTFTDEAEAIAIANQTDLGLAGYFYSRNISRIYRVAEALETGMVGINTGSISTEVAPFGGIKQSGLGREGAKYGIDEYTEIKYLCIDVTD
ncbi:NAD-dependent succinate-semialdehyde dehydrogenase [Ostreibacterium oceani]|uniref:NAD-dependent succinate-semialdehyde dehydrogenase n=1 Tax=Ostreibacterium oceani TaxID=2654998 RepID=UPI0038B2418C